MALRNEPMLCWDLPFHCLKTQIISNTMRQPFTKLLCPVTNFASRTIFHTERVRYLIPNQRDDLCRGKRWPVIWGGFVTKFWFTNQNRIYQEIVCVSVCLLKQPASGNSPNFSGHTHIDVRPTLHEWFIRLPPLIADSSRPKICFDRISKFITPME